MDGRNSESSDWQTWGNLALVTRSLNQLYFLQVIQATLSWKKKK